MVLIVALTVVCIIDAPVYSELYDGMNGQWRWQNGATVTINPDGNCDATNGFIGVWRRLGPGKYEIKWKRPGQQVQYIDTVQLSADANKLEGKNQLF